MLEENEKESKDETPKAETETQADQASVLEASSELHLEAFFGLKKGMSSAYTPEGIRIPVTILECHPWTVTQVKTKKKEGYEAIQLSCGPRKLKNSKKPEIGHFKKAGLETGMRYCHEVRQKVEGEATLGQKVTVDMFKKGQKVKVSATSKGKGFSGSIKRHNFAGGPGSHGSGFHRRPGSIGNCEFPGRVIKGKKMAGQHGNVNCTTLGLEVVEVIPEQHILILKGAVPGAVNSLVKITQMDWR